MPQINNVLIDASNPTFPHDASLINLRGVKRVIISDIINDDNLDIVINIPGRSEGVQLPMGRIDVKEIEVKPNWLGMIFISTKIPANKKATFKIETI